MQTTWRNRSVLSDGRAEVLCHELIRHDRVADLAFNMHCTRATYLEVGDRAEALHLVDQHQVVQRARVEEHGLEALFRLLQPRRASLYRVVVLADALRMTETENQSGS